jgi:tRNA(fMet)-specific endonuclease VapC
LSKRLLDTDILSEILKGKDPIVARHARAYREQHGQYTYTVLSVLEIVRGLRRVGAEGRLQTFLSSLGFDEVLPFDTDSAVLAGEIDASLASGGRPIGVADVIVAAIALRNGLPLVTGNESHYSFIRDAGHPLAIENWRRDS